MGSDTPERLIRATGRLLRKQGYAGTGLNQIVAEAKAPKGSMYFHFPGGKQTLAAAAVDRFAARITERMTQTLASSETVADAVASFFDADIAHLERTQMEEGCAVAAVALDAAPANRTLTEATRRALSTWTETMTKALEDEGHPAADAHALATLVVAAIEGGIVLSKGQGSTEPLAATRDALLAVLAAGPRPDDRAQS